MLVSADFSFNLLGSSTSKTDSTSGIGPVLAYSKFGKLTCIADHPSAATDPVATNYGALFNSKNMMCSDSGYANMDLGDTFVLTMRVYLFDLTST